MNSDDQQKAAIAGLYSRAASTYGSVGPNHFAYVGQHLVDRLGIRTGGRVLDVAAGRGANLFPAAQKVGPEGQAIGIDLAEGMVRETSAEIRRRGVPQASMLQMDAEHLNFPNAAFDAITCGFAIFFFPQLEQALAEFFRVLCPGGKLGISVARNLDALSHWYGEHITEYHQQHQFPLRVGIGKGSNYAELPQYLTQAGFTNVQIHQEQADFVYADAQQWWDARWTHGPRYALEHMEPAVLAQFQAEVFAKLAEEAQKDGIHETMSIQYILSEKSAN